MKIKKGDVVKICVKIHDKTLLKGVGIVMDKAKLDIDDIYQEKDKTRIQDDCWMIYMSDTIFMVREKYMKKLTKCK